MAALRGIFPGGCICRSGSTLVDLIHIGTSGYIEIDITDRPCTDMWFNRPLNIVKGRCGLHRVDIRRHIEGSTSVKRFKSDPVLLLPGSGVVGDLIPFIGYPISVCDNFWLIEFKKESFSLDRKSTRLNSSHVAIS